MWVLGLLALLGRCRVFLALLALCCVGRDRWVGRADRVGCVAVSGCFGGVGLICSVVSVWAVWFASIALRALLSLCSWLGVAWCGLVWLGVAWCGWVWVGVGCCALLWVAARCCALLRVAVGRSRWALRIAGALLSSGVAWLVWFGRIGRVC